MKRFILINSIRHYQEIARTRGELLVSHQVVTADIGVAAVLERERRPFHELWEYLSDAELEGNYQLAWDLSKNWHLIDSDALTCFGAHPLRSSPVEMIVPLETALNAALAFERLIERHRPVEILGTADTVPVYRYGPFPIERGTAGIAEAVAHWLCDKQGIEFLECRVAVPELPRLKGPPLLRQRVEAAQEDPRPAAPASRPLLMLLELGQNVSEMFELESTLHRTGRFRLVRVSELARPHYPLAVPLPEEVNRALQTCEAASRRARGEYRGDYPFIFANRHLEFQFEGMWGEVRRSCETGAFLDPLLDSLAPDAILVGADCFTCEGLVRDIAARRGIMTAVLLHSGLACSRGWRDLCSPADVTFTWGEVDSAPLMGHGVAPERIAMVGSLRYHTRFSAAPAPEPEAKRQAIKARLGLSGVQSIVSLLSAQSNFGLAWSFSHPAAHRRGITEIIKWAEANPQIGVLLKPHPSYDHAEYFRFIRAEFPVNVRFVEGETLNDILAVSDAAFLLNFCTTAALEAFPTIPVVFARSGYRHTASLETSLEGDVVPQVSSVAELTRVLPELLGRDSLLRQRCMEKQWAFLQKASWNDDDRRPAQRIADEITRRLALRKRGAAPVSDGAADGGRPSVLSALWDGSPEKQAASWGQALAALSPPQRSPFLIATAMALSSTAAGPKELAAAVRSFRREMAKHDSAPQNQAFALATFLSAMLRALNRRHWNEVFQLAIEAGFAAPRAALLSPLFRRVLGRAAVSRGLPDRAAVRALLLSPFAAR